MQSWKTEITMVKWTNAGGQTKRANERSFVYRPPAWRRWRNVKNTYNLFLEVNRFLIVNFFDVIFLAPCCDGTFTYNLLWDRPSSYKVFYMAEIIEAHTVARTSFYPQKLYSNNTCKQLKSNMSWFKRTESRRRFFRAKGEISRMRAHEWRMGEVPLVQSIKTNPKN